METLSLRLREFNNFIQEQSINSINKINYQHLLQFVADYGTPSPSVKKARVWSLHQFFHYLKLICCFFACLIAPNSLLYCGVRLHQWLKTLKTHLKKALNYKFFSNFFKYHGGFNPLNAGVRPFYFENN
ncbi:hypothetical protein H8E88_02610 [candidate division KSB1 bacterium]|nr:hypothetical protein [candidate division KSB1 bacterium]